MARKKSENSKTKTIQIRLTNAEYSLYKFKTRQFQKQLGIKINTSKLLRLTLERATNMQFLHTVGYLSYVDLMDAYLFEKTKYKRLKKCKR